MSLYNRVGDTTKPEPSNISFTHEPSKPDPAKLFGTMIQSYNRHCDTQMTDQPALGKALCTANDSDTSQLKKKGRIGFFLPHRNIFVPCKSKQEYFYIKKKLMEKKLKQGTSSKTKGFCYAKTKGAEKREQLETKLNNCSVNDGSNEYFDMYSCDYDKVQYM